MDVAAINASGIANLCDKVYFSTKYTAFFDISSCKCRICNFFKSFAITLS